MKLTCVTATWNVIKAGNRESLIRCVKSVAGLKTEHEHLIYDGGSTDGTVELLCELAASEPSLKVVSEKDSGIYNALNKGVRDARGEWFYVLGADDYLSRPQIMDGILCQSDDIDMIVTATDMSNGGVWFRSMRSARRFMMYNCFPHQGTLLRTKFVRDEGGFDENNRISADYDMHFRAHLANLRIRYTFFPYAMFAKGGASSLAKECEECDYLVLGRHLGLMRGEYDRRKSASLPIRRVVKFLFHSDMVMRMSARHMVCRRITYYAYRWLFYTPLGAFLIKNVYNVLRKSHTTLDV